jgi:hypothetical protein
MMPLTGQPLSRLPSRHLDTTLIFPRPQAFPVALIKRRAGESLPKALSPTRYKSLTSPGISIDNDLVATWTLGTIAISRSCGSFTTALTASTPTADIFQHLLDFTLFQRSILVCVRSLKDPLHALRKFILVDFSVAVLIIGHDPGNHVSGITTGATSLGTTSLGLAFTTATLGTTSLGLAFTTATLGTTSLGLTFAATSLGTTPLTATTNTSRHHLF